jgi:hypothetical protein
LNTFVCEIRSRDFLVNESILKHISEFKKIEKTEKELAIRSIFDHYDDFYDLNFLHAIAVIYEK